MKLVTLRQEGLDSIGALLGERVVLLTRAYAGHLASLGIDGPYPLAAAQLPNDMLAFLRAGERATVAASRALEHVQQRTARGEELRGPRGERLVVDAREIQLLAPIPRPGKILAVGLNYRDHAEETNLPLPERPVLFPKYSSCVVGPGASVLMPKVSEEVDYEVELGVVIGKMAKRVPEAEAMEYVAGYTLVNDVTARDLQLRLGGGQWTHGKCLDTFCPMGPALVTRDEVPDPHNLAISLRVNGRLMQNSNTSNLVFNVPTLISYFSQDITLEPGDVISTGTPPGVGYIRKPPFFLRKGDVMVGEIEKVGILENRMV